MEQFDRVLHGPITEQDGQIKDVVDRRRVTIPIEVVRKKVVNFN